MFFLPTRAAARILASSSNVRARPTSSRCGSLSFLAFRSLRRIRSPRIAHHAQQYSNFIVDRLSRCPFLETRSPVGFNFAIGDLHKHPSTKMFNEVLGRITVRRQQPIHPLGAVAAHIDAALLLTEILLVSARKGAQKVPQRWCCRADRKRGNFSEFRAVYGWLSYNAK